MKEAVIVSGARTAVGRAPRGSLRASRPDDMAGAAIAEAVARAEGLEVAEVAVQAMERQGSKVRMLADALGMLGEVWTVRRARTNGADGDMGQTPSFEATARLADVPLTAPNTPSGPAPTSW